MHIFYIAWYTPLRVVSLKITTERKYFTQLLTGKGDKMFQNVLKKHRKTAVTFLAAAMTLTMCVPSFFAADTGSAPEKPSLEVTVSDDGIAKIVKDKDQNEVDITKAAPFEKEVAAGDVYNVNYTVPADKTLTVTVDQTKNNVKVEGDVTAKDASNFAASKDKGTVKLTVSGNAKVSFTAAAKEEAGTAETAKPDTTAAPKADAAKTDSFQMVNDVTMKSESEEASWTIKTTSSKDQVEKATEKRLSNSGITDAVSVSMTSKIDYAGRHGNGLKKVLAANELFTRRWGNGPNDVNTAKLLADQGNPAHTACTQFVTWALENVYGIHGVSGTASGEEQQLKSMGAKYISTVRSTDTQASASYQAVKPGDIACYGGHVAIVTDRTNANGLMVMHAGVGQAEDMSYPSPRYSPQISWSLLGSVRGKMQGSGALATEARIYRVLNVKQYGFVVSAKGVKDNTWVTETCPASYSLEGAEFTIYNEDGKTVATDKNGNPAIVKTDKNGNAPRIELEAGKTYIARETKAPAGYSGDLDVKTHEVADHRFTLSPNATVNVSVKDSPQFDPVNILLQKTATDGSYLNNGNMEGAEFAIKYYDAVTDNVSGLAPVRTWKLKTIKNNVGAYTANLREKYLLDGSDELFKTDDGVIGIPRGTITVTETKAPKGYKVDPKVYTYKIDQDHEDGSMQFNFGNTPEQPNQPLVPKIGTQAADVNTGINVGTVNKSIKIVDHVAYKELSEGETYTVKGTLMDKETGKPLQVNGKTVTAEKKFTVTKDNSTIDGNGAAGTVDLEYTLDSSALAGKTTVVFEHLYYDGKEVATHADINDNNQTIHFPNIHTTLQSKKAKSWAKIDENGNVVTGGVVDENNQPVNKPADSTEKVKDGHFGTPDKQETLVDTVAYTNLVPGKEYTVKGTLMNKKTGKAIVDKDGKEITAEKKFTPNAQSGSVDIEFTYDSSLLKGTSTVAFEHLYYNDKEVVAHADINDEGQTVHYPDIGTTLKDGKDGDKVVTAEKSVKLVDTVKYTSLVPGKEYTVTGTLMDKATGKPLQVNGKDVTAKATFTAEKADGETEVTFTFDGSALKQDQKLVAFEDVYHNGVEVATHADINDEGQTVTMEQPPKGPKTGDMSGMGKWIILLVVVVAAAAGSTFYIKKKESKNNK